MPHQIVPTSLQMPNMPLGVEYVKNHCVMWTDYFPAEWCDHMIQQYDRPDLLRLAGVGVHNEINEDTINSRLCQTYPLDLREEQEFVDDVYRSAMKVNSEFFNFDIHSIQQAEFLKYEGNPVRGQTNYYDWHVDPLWHRNSDRKITCIVQLSDTDDYEGGNFETKGDIGSSIPIEHRKKGTLIMFNSSVPHQITPVLAGIRHSIVVWVQGPPWR